MRRILTYFSLLVVLLSCIDQVQVPVRVEAPRLVVEGEINNEAVPYVRLTYTGNYSDAGQSQNQYVQGAQVSVSDDRGRRTALLPIGQGIYRTTDTTFRGQVGRSYSLTVTLTDGKRYVSAAEQMPGVPVIDSISAKPVKTGTVLVPYAVQYGVNTRDPASETNYYRWTAFGYTSRLSVGVPCSLGNPNNCNYRCWTPVYSTNVLVYSDNAINGNPIRNQPVFQIPIYSNEPQLVEIQQYGITRSNYQFWQLYKQQNARTGSIFDPLPAPVVGNVVNVSDPTDRARGYFAVFSITRKRLKTYSYASPFYGAITSFIASQIIPPGDCRNTYGNVPLLQPDGW